MAIDELKELLNSFLNKWNIDKIKEMKLEDYVGIGNKDTFCQWVETKTRILGSIKGLTSIKFGIYERKIQEKRPKNYKSDDKYSWLQKYGDTKEEVFRNIKEEIINIIYFSEKGQFEKIDSIKLPDLFKWKIAFLYSNERLIPIYKKDLLFKIAENYKLEKEFQTKISKIQEIMISNKPSNKNVYEYMQELCIKFNNNKEKLTIKNPSKKEKRTKRVASGKKNLEPQTKTTNYSSYLVEQKHNKIQEILKNQLIDKYGKENVKLEENYVDIKLIQPDYLEFYEIKSSLDASDCIREALGQLLFYVCHDTEIREKKIYVVGQYPPNKQDEKYIDYIKN
jgi:hypothetical protein